NLRDGKIEYDYVTKWVDEGIRLRTRTAISLNQWHHVALTYTGSRWATGVRIYVDGEDRPLEILIDDFNAQGAVKREPLRIGADSVSAESARAGAVAGGSGESTDGARDGEPVLADVLQRRDRKDH